MKILIISHEYPPIGGGGANACMYLAREYAKNNHAVDIVTVWYEGLQEKEIIDDYSGTITIYRVKAKRSKKESCGFAEMLDFIHKADSFACKLVADAENTSSKYDICQIFFGIPSGPIGYHLKKKYHLPYVVRFGGGDIPGFQERFKTIYKLIGPFVKIIWKNADGLVANSKGLQEFALDFCSKYTIDVIYNGVDTEKYYPLKKNDSESDNSEIRLLFISRLIERKGLQYLIPRIKDIETATAKKVRLLIVGDGPYRSILENMAEQYGISDNVIFYGQKDKSELRGYYQQGDVFVFPSKKEGMPNAVLEAMACGLPVVMSPCQGSDELIEENGLIADADLDRFYESVVKYINLTEEEQSRMSDVSRKRAEEIFSWKSVANDYIKMFDRIGSCV